MRRFILACAGLLVCCCCSITGGARTGHCGRIRSEATTAAATDGGDQWLGSEIDGYQSATWRWQRLMGVRPRRRRARALTEMSIPDVQRAVRLWQRRAIAHGGRRQKPPHLAAWLCIHHYEGSWTDGGGPYYGGLQMDLGFQRTYAPRLLRTKGTADHWTPLEQIWTAEKAAKSRGFWPWPNTARFCGLI